MLMLYYPTEGSERSKAIRKRMKNPFEGSFVLSFGFISLSLSGIFNAFEYFM